MSVWLAKDSMDKVYEFNDFLNEEDRQIVENEFNQYEWKFDGREYSSEKTGVTDDMPLRTFWSKEMSDSPILNAVFQYKVEQALGTEVETIRIQGNGQSHGQSAWKHSDAFKDTEGIFGTLIYYVHKDWKPEYGGHIMLLTDDKNDVTRSYWPRSNSAIMFDSKINHIALEPTVYCLTQRVSIAYKFKVK